MSIFKQAVFYRDPALYGSQIGDDFFQPEMIDDYMFQYTNNTHKSISTRITNSANSSESGFLAYQPYFLQYDINPNEIIKYKIQLTSPEDRTLSPQTIQLFHKLYINKNSNPTKMNVVFVPFVNFEELTFSRIDDKKINPPLSSNYTFNNISIKKMRNLIWNLTSNKTITKIGIQANPFTYFVLNQQPIRVGRNGIYQVEGIDINSFYAAPVDESDFFIIDYTYNS